MLQRYMIDAVKTKASISSQLMYIAIPSELPWPNPFFSLFTSRISYSDNSFFTPFSSILYSSDHEYPGQFPGVHWVWKGDISFVYEVHPHIVVKVPKSDEFEREQFQKEVKIYEKISRNPPCPSVVHCCFYTYTGVFLKYMRGRVYV